jgi:solute carrier family 25 carnitine/acylcarnitine transporter 20/29
MDTPLEKRRLFRVGREIVRKEGVSALFRGLNITIIRAFPVNAIVFPVYEFCLMKLAALEY